MANPIESAARKILKSPQATLGGLPEPVKWVLALVIGLLAVWGVWSLFMAPQGFRVQGDLCINYRGVQHMAFIEEKDMVWLSSGECHPRKRLGDLGLTDYPKK